MAQNVINYHPTLSATDVRWAEMANDTEQDKIRPEKHMQGTKLKDDHALPHQRTTHSPNTGLKVPQEQRENRNNRSNLERGARGDEFVSNLDYFMHSGYPYPHFNLHARRDSPPDLMAVERAKQAFVRANEGFFPGATRSMPPDLSTFSQEQIEALYKSQNIGIPLTISPPDLTERAGIIPPGNRSGPGQRPSPQTERQHGDFGNNHGIISMDEKLLRIAEANGNLQKAAARGDRAAHNPGLYPGIVRLPPTAASQMQTFQNQQNNLRLNQELMRQFAAGLQFGIDPRLLEHNRAYQQMLAARNEHSPSDGNSQPIIDAGGTDTSQKKTLHHGPARPAALGQNFVPQSHLPQSITQGTPNSEDIGSGSPAGSSPYADIGTPSPKSDDHARMGTKQKAKSRNDGANQCSQCGKGFSSSSALAKHKLIHSDERRYVCQLCSKGFKRQDHLNGHMITHRDKKPYECSFSDCDKSYSDMRSLKRHLENHHGVPPVTSSSSFHTQAGHSTQYLNVSRGSNLLHPGSVEDRNNNMKGAAQPERPSSAPSGTPEIRTRSRIRSNSCEDLPNQSERDVANDETRGDAKEEYDDDAFISSEPKKEEASTSSTEPQSRTSMQLDNSGPHGNIPGSQDRANIPSPHNSSLHQQWPGGQFAGANFPVSWNSAPTQWNNAQLVASMGLAQGHGNLPFMMGYRQPYQQFCPPGYYPGNTNDPTSQMEPSIKKSKPDLIPTSQNVFNQSALQMFASMAAQRTPIPTDMLMNQGAIGCYGENQSAANKATNPAAIAIAAAKAGSLFCVPHDMRLYGAHPGATQWQDVLKQENFGDDRSQNVKKMEEDSKVQPKVELDNKDLNSAMIKENGTNQNGLPDTSKPHAGKSNHSQDFQSPPQISVVTTHEPGNSSTDQSAVSPRRKNRPHPGPIIIPASVNNKVTHSVTFSYSSVKPASPVKMGYPHPPIYTPPPMLSPRSIFFTGTSTGTPRSAVPLTPGRLLLSARRSSSTLEGTKEEESEPIVIPEPKINIGPLFQAKVAKKLEPRENAQKDEHRATLMWGPLKEDKNKRHEVENFLEMACSMALFGGSSNKEYALHILHRTRGNVKEAIRLLLNRRHILRADDPNADYHYSGSSRWTAKERLKFREAYRTKGKNFHLIQKEVVSKSVEQCVEFYYLWKATNPDGFRARTRYVEVESEQEEEESNTPSVFEAPLPTSMKDAVFQCDYPECQARFVSRQALNGHIRVHGGSFGKPVEVRKPRPKTHVIITPSLPRDNSITPQKRKKSPPPTSQNNTPATADGVPLQFACKVCGRVFSKVKSRSAHMKTHVPKKPDDHTKSMNPPPLVAHA